MCIEYMNNGIASWNTYTRLGDLAGEDWAPYVSHLKKHELTRTSEGDAKKWPIWPSIEGQPRVGSSFRLLCTATRVVARKYFFIIGLWQTQCEEKNQESVPFSWVIHIVSPCCCTIYLIILSQRNKKNVLNFIKSSINITAVTFLLWFPRDYHVGLLVPPKFI